MDNEVPKRKHVRLKNYDYSEIGAYFITICTQNRKNILSRIVTHELGSAEIQYTLYGKIAERQLLMLEERYPTVKVDQYVVMPNHIHVILFLKDAAGASPRPTIMDIICAYKSLTTRECNRIQPNGKLFQTSFYEHVIRGEKDYQEIAEYINTNPDKWNIDKLFVAEKESSTLC